MRRERVTLKAIAKQAGVTVAAVSYALHDHPGIAPATRERIKSVARELGYHPDPILGNLMSYLRTGSGKAMPYRATIGYLADFPEAATLHRMHTYEQFFCGAKKRANELGFRMEEFWLREPGMTGERMSRILRARGIPGVIVAPAPEQEDYPRIAWEHFASVIVGHTQWNPLLHRSCNNQLHSLRLALGTMRQLGYRRIGCAFSTSVDVLMDHNLLSAYLADQHVQPPEHRVPIFRTEDWSLRTFSEWFHFVRPEAVVSFQVPVLGWLREMGVRVPEEVGFATVDVFPADPPLAAAGVEQPSGLIGGAAVDLLASQIAYHERGVPANPKLLLLEGHWQNGPTVRPQPGRKRSSQKAKSAERRTLYVV